MRPIDRGELPMDSNGKPIVFKHYQEASYYLYKRIGRYCSYCERIIKSGLAIEHIRPKSLYPDKECDWNNFLLSCPNCNSVKGNQDVNDENIDDYFWPDRDNTCRAFVYQEGGTINVNPNLPQDAQAKSRRSLQLLGLDRVPSKDIQYKDLRWKDRFDAWKKAQELLGDLHKIIAENPNLADEFRKLIVKAATDCFSIWLTVFADDPEVCNQLIMKFEGTARDCFDSNGQPVPRPSGQI